VDTRKVGVEEELMLVDPTTGMLTAVAGHALRAHEQEGRDDAPVEPELFLQQIESQTPPTTDVTEIAGHLRASRRAMGEAARAAGAAAVATGTPVLVDDELRVTPKPRYRRIVEEYGELARSALACAMHVHVDVADEEEGLRALGGITPWLPVLLAVSANSPYAHGRDTGYASWRYQTWSRWPSHGSGGGFADAADYRVVTERLLEWGAALDDGMLYLDARPSRSFPTLELRVADVCGDVEDAVLVTALCRALVATEADHAADGGPPEWRDDLLRAAGWRASRYGVSERLVDPRRLSLVPAREAIGALLDHTRHALDAAGDTALVEDQVERLLARGNGATQQRRTFERTGNLADVVSDAVVRTEASWSS
jgi:carboxylate-amine ligase